MVKKIISTFLVLVLLLTASTLLFACVRYSTVDVRLMRPSAVSSHQHINRNIDKKVKNDS